MLVCGCWLFDSRLDCGLIALYCCLRLVLVVFCFVLLCLLAFTCGLYYLRVVVWFITSLCRFILCCLILFVGVVLLLVVLMSLAECLFFTCFFVILYRFVISVILFSNWLAEFVLWFTGSVFWLDLLIPDCFGGFIVS